MAVPVQPPAFGKKNAPLFNYPLALLKSQNKAVLFEEVNSAEGAYGIPRFNVRRLRSMLEQENFC